MQLSFGSPRLLPRSSCCSDVLTANGECSATWRARSSKRNCTRTGRRLAGARRSSTTASKSVTRRTSCCRTSSRADAGTLALVVGLQGREKDQALEKVVARSRNLPQRDDRNQTMLFTACFHVLREAPASKVRQSDAEGNASHDSSGIFLLRSASAWFLHVRASLCSAKVLFWVDDFGVELLVLARRLLMKTRVPVTAESILHCRTLTRLIKLSTRWLSHERAS